VAHFAQVLFLHARDRLFLTAKPLDFFSLKDAKFPILNHGAMWPLTCVRTSENVAELVRQLFERFGLVTEEVELLERRLPFRLPLPFNRLDLKIDDFRGPNNAERNFLDSIEAFAWLASQRESLSAHLNH
jgi:hypothetical protein